MAASCAVGIHQQEIFDDLISLFGENVSFVNLRRCIVCCSAPWPDMAAGAGVTAAAEEESTSFVLDPEGHFYVQDQFAVYANGVRRSDNKVFGVDLSTLKVEAAIGRGACGVVRRAVHVPTGTLVALKVRHTLQFST